MKRNTKHRIAAAAVIIILLLPFLWWQNTGLIATRITYRSGQVPAGFDGCRIVQVSDLHDNRYGEKQENILKMTREAAPDYIFITGDLIECDRMENALQYVREAAAIAPVYYVPGNHETKSLSAYQTLRQKIREFGGTVLEDEAVTLYREGSEAKLIGLRDPNFTNGGLLRNGAGPEIQKSLARLSGGKVTGGEIIPVSRETARREFTMLLCHRPELMEEYEKNNIDLAFAGHVHGGIVRLPGVGAVYGLNQGFFPKYSAGLCQKGETSMVVSRGAGNNPIGQRINNRPELVVVELQRAVPPAGSSAFAVKTGAR